MAATLNNTILVVDDDAAIRASLNLMLRKAGYDTVEAADPDEALSRIRHAAPSLCILDMNFSRQTSGEEGLELLREIRHDSPGLPVILITAWGSISLAVEGMKLGASDFITKPWNNEFLLSSIRTILHLSRPDRPDEGMVYDRPRLNELYDFEGIIGNDRGLLEVLNVAGRVSDTEAPVLILGESGTGKELVAEAIHANSRRRNGPFIKVNLGGIHTSLFESEMFGHKKGAFTGAASDRIGRFEMAHRGTIFLDEIGDLDAGSQVKLLRVLQDRSFEALGTSTPRFADFRLISATNRDLAKMVLSGHFREDLYYRINLITLHLPALHDRRDDIPLLVRHFVDNMRRLYDRSQLRISAPAMNWLTTLPWSGNVRELKNLVERTVLVSTSDLLEIGDFKANYQLLPGQSAVVTIPDVGTVTLEEMEKSMIRKAMQFHQGNISKVALSLGLSRGALYRRLEKFGLIDEAP